MIWKNTVTQILSFSSLLVTVNSYVIQLSPDPQNNVDIQNINDRLSLRRIGKFVSNPTTQKDTVTETTTEAAIPTIETTLTAENDAMTLQQQQSHPKRRVKRFTCWHSCLGPWKKKNPKTKAYRYRIKNVGVAQPSAAKPEGSNEETSGNGDTPDKPDNAGKTPDKGSEPDKDGVPSEEKGTPDGQNEKENDKSSPNEDKVKSIEDTSDDEKALDDKAEDEDEKKEIKRNIGSDDNAFEELGSQEESDENDNEIDEEDENYVDPAAV